MIDVNRELQPKGKRWGRLVAPAALCADPAVLACSAWCRGSFTVISALEVAEYPDGNGTGPQWHISIGLAWTPERSGRPSVVSGVLRSFGMTAAEEDNHHPGAARHFWMPVDPSRRVDCECKTTEVTIVEPDGYKWTNPVDGPCRGCEFEKLLGHPCTIHEATEQR